MTHTTLVSQILLFLIAGFETTANALSFAIYLLAKNPEIQREARKEIEDLTKANNGKLTYESIMEAKYLEACFSGKC